MTHLRRAALAAAILFSISSAWAKDDKWVEARSSNFIVVSNASPQQARNTAIQFEQIRDLFQNSFVFAKDRPSPVITILAAKDENTLRSLLPEYWDKKGHAHPAGMFLNYQYQLQVAVQLTGLGDNPYETIYHEYYHSLTMPYFPALPVWISEGMADFYGNSKIVDKTAYLGMSNAGLMEQLHEQSLIPIGALFRVDHASPYYNESSKVSIFYAESWALMHYLMLGDNGAHRQQLMVYLDALSHGATQDEAATKAFGDLGKLQKALQSYANSNVFYEMHTPAPAKVPESDVRIRPLSDSEAGAYRGGFLTLHGQFSDAEMLLQEAARTDPKLAVAQQNLAVLYYAQDKSEEARAALDAAIELDPQNALTRYLRANLSSKEIDSRLRDSQAEADLRAAIAANPNFAPPYGLLATRLAANGEKLSEAFELAKKGVLLEPGSSYYQLDLAQVLARMRKYDEAQALATRAGDNPLDPQARKKADRLIEYIQELRNAETRYTYPQRAPSPVDNVAETATDSGEPETTERPVNDGKLRIDGTVTDVQCKVQEMVLTVSTEDGPMKLHSLDDRKIDFISDVPIKSEVFRPCTELKGRTVKVKFTPAGENAKQQYQGEITDVEIKK
jgi:tetratricopeptide (TPR) repeat protein